MDWVRPDDLDRTEREPGLYPEITVLVEVEQDRLEFSNPPEMRPELRRLDDYPEVEEAWLEYLVDQWEPWAKEMRRWQKIQNVYENLDFMRRRLEEAEERYELLLAVGLLQWRDPMDTPVRRLLLAAPAEIVLDAARGLLSVVPAASFERFRIELDMLDLQHQPSLDEAAIESQLDELDIQAWNTSRVQGHFTLSGVGGAGTLPSPAGGEGPWSRNLPAGWADVPPSLSGRALARAPVGGGLPAPPFRLRGGFTVPP